MSITKEDAIKLAEKILKDIGFWGDDLINPHVILIDGEKLKFRSKSDPYWSASFNYGGEDFGEGGASVFIRIDVKTGIPENSIFTRSGSIRIQYDQQKDKYSRIKK